jgi:YjjG family noncanonical pyrimidine nucleotidase
LLCCKFLNRVKIHYDLLIINGHNTPRLGFPSVPYRLNDNEKGKGFFAYRGNTYLWRCMNKDSMKIPEFIYFDLDDTLLDHTRAEKAALRDIWYHYDYLRKISTAKLQTEYHNVNRLLWEEYGSGRIDRAMLQRRRFEDTLNNLGFDGSVHREMGRRYMERYRTHWHWIDGAQEALKDLSRQYHVGFITNGFSETQKLKVRQFGLDRISQCIVISEDIGIMKPDPRIFEHAARLAGVPASSILYVGDSWTSDIQGGTSCGWDTAWYVKVPNGDEAKKAPFVFSDFTQLTGRLLD